jgi:hypothetical protein
MIGLNRDADLAQDHRQLSQAHLALVDKPPCHVCISFDHAGGRKPGSTDANSKSHLWMAICHLLEYSWHDGVGKRLDREQIDMPGMQSPQRLQLGSHAMRILHHVDRMPRHHFTRWRQAQARMQPLKQRRPDLVLDCKQLPIER